MSRLVALFASMSLSDLNFHYVPLIELPIDLGSLNGIWQLFETLSHLADTAIQQVMSVKIGRTKCRQSIAPPTSRL